MLSQSNRLGVGLTTLFAFALAGVSARAQVVILPTISSGWDAMAAALGPNGIFVVGTDRASESYFVASSVSFNGAVGGIVENTVAGAKYQAWPYTSAVDSEGRLLSAGMAGAKGGDTFTVVRYNTDGSLDTTFGKKGIATTQFNGLLTPTLRAMTLQYSGANEKIVVAGSNWEQNPVMLARYTDKGVLDATFGVGGTVSTTTPFQWVIVEDMAVQSNGSIIVCALGSLAGEPQAMVLMRYTPNGQLDTTFGTNGYATLTIDGEDTDPRAIAVDDDDSIVVAGGYGGNVYEMALGRFTADGGLDTTFGEGGVVTESFAGIASAVAIDDDGNIVISAGDGGNLVVARFTGDGDLNGYADDFAYGASIPAHSVQLQPSSSDPLGYKILAVGMNANAVTAVVRYNSDGTPDTTF